VYYQLGHAPFDSVNYVVKLGLFLVLYQSQLTVLYISNAEEIDNISYEFTMLSM
jgi:hypothetical protein